MAGLALGGAIFVMLIPCVFVPELPGCTSWLRDRIARAELEITNVSLKDITLDTATVDMTLRIHNPSLFGIALNRVTYTIYFGQEGEWVELGRATSTEDVAIDAGGSATLNITNEIETLLAARLMLWGLVQQGAVNLKATGNAQLKVGPISFKVPFERVQTVSLGEGILILGKSISRDEITQAAESLMSPQML
jgi:LEA14-like dessication related protein